MSLFTTRKYPLGGYFLGVLTHTTAWDRLWGGDVFVRLYIRSLASPRIAAVRLGCWNCEHVILRVAIRIDIRIYDHDETWKCDGMQVAGCQLALPCVRVVLPGFWNSDHIVLKLSIQGV